MMKNSMSPVPFVFFGTGEIAVGVLNELEKASLLPTLIVTSPDKPAGRGGTLTPSPVKTWASARHLEILQPEKLDPAFILSLAPKTYPLFVVVDYGAFLPAKLLVIPEHGTLNMHPSLLPRLRGPSPIRSAILNDEKETGVSVMLVDEKMDHGPIIARKKIPMPRAGMRTEYGFALHSLGDGGPPHGRELDVLLASAGGKLLAEIIPLWVSGKIEAHEQNHDVATFSQMFSKEDGLLDLVNGDPYQNLLKIRAFEGWPGTYTFFERGGKRIRTQIIDAHMDGKKLVIDRVKPEGKQEMSHDEFARSGAKAAAN